MLTYMRNMEKLSWNSIHRCLQQESLAYWECKRSYQKNNSSTSASASASTCLRLESEILRIARGTKSLYTRTTDGSSYDSVTLAQASPVGSTWTASATAPFENVDATVKEGEKEHAVGTASLVSLPRLLSPPQNELILYPPEQQQQPYPCNESDVLQRMSLLWEKTLYDEVKEAAKEKPFNDQLVLVKKKARTSLDTQDSCEGGVSMANSTLNQNTDASMAMHERNDFYLSTSLELEEARKAQEQGKFLYDYHDLYAFIKEESSSISSFANNAQDPRSNRPRTPAPAWGVMASLRFKIPDSQELSILFSDLLPLKHPIIERQDSRSIEKEKEQKPREFLKRGSSVSLRPKVWLQVMNISRLSTEKVQLYNRLLNEARKYHFVTDDMYNKDVIQTSKDPSYFPFEEILFTTMKVFAIDASIGDSTRTKLNLPSPLIHPESKSTMRVPWNGVLPFRGLVMYAAPLCYLYDNPVELYFAFRFFYVTFWCKLNALFDSRDSQSLLMLCQQFEQVLQERHPEVFFHCIHHNIDPLEIAFPWLHSAFSGYLEIDQLLLLWDRLLGYEDLTLLPLLAVGIFRFRSHDVLALETLDDMKMLFEDFKEIQTLPLLQYGIFG